MRRTSQAVRVVVGVAALSAALCATARASSLILTSEPPGGVVTIGEQQVGTTPYTVHVPDTYIGSVRVQITFEGRVPFVCEVNVVPEQQIVIKALLVPVSDVGGAPGGGPGNGLPPDPHARIAPVRQQIEAALARFRQDCGAWPAALLDLTVASGADLSDRINAAGERIRGESYAGPYLASLPTDPVTRAVDWVYDSATGVVQSRAELPAAARLPGAPIVPGQVMTVESWVDLFCKAIGLTASGSGGAAPTPGADHPSVRTAPPPGGGEGLAEWRPL